MYIYVYIYISAMILMYEQAVSPHLPETLRLYIEVLPPRHQFSRQTSWSPDGHTMSAHGSSILKSNPCCVTACELTRLATVGARFDKPWDSILGDMGNRKYGDDCC